MGSMNVFTGGAWRKAKGAHVFAGGAWRKAKAVWVFAGGAWKKMGFGTEFSFDIAAGDYGVFGYSSDSRIGLLSGGIYPNPVPEIGTITDFWWRNDMGLEYSFAVQGVPDGTFMELSIPINSGKTVSGPIRVGGDTAQSIEMFGESMQYLIETYTYPATKRIILSK